MADYSEVQATLIARTLLDRGVGQALANPTIKALDSLRLLVEQQRLYFKKPSIYKTVSQIAPAFQYSLNVTDAVGQYLASLFTNTGGFTVLVYPIDVADEIELTGILNDASLNNFPTALFAALSPTEVTNQLSADQFFQLRMQAIASDFTDALGIYFVNQQIPCSGNRYIHIFGGAGGQDLFGSGPVGPLQGMTLALKK